jgi:hypothetical protein
MNKAKLGIIMEDKADVACIKVLIEKITPGKYAIKGIGTKGGGKMFNAVKMTAWTRSFYAESCNLLLVIHDLDRDRITNELNDEKQLKANLETALANNPISKKCIVIPIEELEAWLLSDKYSHPQSIPNPKKELRKLNRNYLTSDNAKIAGRININDIAGKCPSFRPLQEFLKTNA